MKTLSSKAAPLVILFLSVILFVSVVTKVAATCGDTQNQRDPFETYNPNASCPLSFTKTLHWTIYWLDSNVGRNVDVSE